jgi:hypothetical protein
MNFLRVEVGSFERGPIPIESFRMSTMTFCIYCPAVQCQAFYFRVRTASDGPWRLRSW